MLTGDFGKLKKLGAAVEALAKPGGKPQARLAVSVIGELRRGPLADQYRTGAGPAGQWTRRADGKPALVSRKLPQMISAKPTDIGARFVWRSPMMVAHHEGHMFAARTGGGHSIFLDENGRSIKLGKLNRRALRRRFVQEVVIARHRVGVRVLPARPQYPRGTMPGPWAEAISAGLRSGMQRWHEHALK